ncbi:MAG TPA: long-chain fatty acid--CoA ligase, partial [Thermoanaerobaculia bacterium]|nr:long-chain fatty acid--CoA ligase [Thermoanaerobaculia bacterium]
ILGRASSDILKTGGYKVSALEIEDVLRLHSAVKDAAVVGLPDEEWGERVAAAVVTGGAPLSLDSLRAFARERLAPYKLPTRLLVLDDLPRNAMGKVTKAAVRTLFGAPPPGR